MLSSYQCRMLVQALKFEPVHVWFTLAKCAAGLAVVALLAVIGASQRGDGDAAVNAPAFAPASSQLATQHRKRVFEERRARFENSAVRHSVVSETARPANHLSTVIR